MKMCPKCHDLFYVSDYFKCPKCNEQLVNHDDVLLDDPHQKGVDEMLAFMEKLKKIGAVVADSLTESEKT